MNRRIWMVLLTLGIWSSAQAQSATTGIPAGPTNWPTDKLGTGNVTGNYINVPPEYMVSTLKNHCAKGVVLFAAWPRRFMTTNGQNVGIFSVSLANALADRYASYFTQSVAEQYAACFGGFVYMDDMACPACWGGQKVTAAQVADVAAHTKQKMPWAILGLRAEPTWIAQSATLARNLDFGWAQYVTWKGGVSTYYNREFAKARLLGIKLAASVNIFHCHGNDSPPCTAAEWRTYGSAALSQSENCAFVNWRYDATWWNRSDIRAVWTDLSRMAQTHVARSCKRS